MGKVEIKKLHKERALLNAAYELFLKYGVRNTSISDITEKASVAKGTFYLYFKDKYDIRDKLVSSKSSEVYLKAYEDMQKTEFADGDIEDKIVYLIENSIDQLASNKNLLSFVAANLDWVVLKNAVVKREEHGETNILQAYHALVDHADGRFRDIELMLFMIIELTNTTVYNAVIYESPVKLDQLKPELFNSIRLIMESFRIK